MAKVQVPDKISEEEMRRLMQAHGSALVGMCTILLHDAHLAQDVTQETFIRAWKHGRLLRETERAWLTRVAVNLCRDQYRSRYFRHVDRRLTPEELPIPADAPQDDASLLDCVYRLPPREREAIVMHYFNDMPSEEIASMLNIDRATVFRRLQRGRKRLRIELEGGSES